MSYTTTTNGGDNVVVITSDVDVDAHSAELHVGLQKVEHLRKRAPRRVLLLNDGDLNIKGWPADMRLTPAVASNLIAEFEKHGTKVPIDYHHATTAVEENTQNKAPAAGFITDLEYVMGEGLFGYVEWNAEGRADVESGAFKYISPVVERNDKGSKTQRDAWKLHSVALTNRPATRQQRELLAAELRRQESNAMPKTTKKKANDPVLEEVAANPELAPEETEAVEAVNEAHGRLAEMLRGMGFDVPDDYSADTLIATAIEALSANADTEAEEAENVKPDETALEAQVKVLTDAVKGLSEKVTGYEAEKKTSEVDRLIAEQVAAHKINPNNEGAMQAAKLLAEQDVNLFKATYDSVAPYVEPGTVTGKHKASDSTARKRVIDEATKEWHANPINQGAPLDGYVNIALDENGLANLNKAELETLRS